MPMSCLRTVILRRSRASRATVSKDARPRAVALRDAGLRPAPQGDGLQKLLIQPYVRQVLVEIVARADLPALEVGAVRNDAVPPRRHQHVRLGFEDVFLELTDQRPLFGSIGLA